MRRVTVSDADERLAINVVEPSVAVDPSVVEPTIGSHAPDPIRRPSC